MKIYVLLPHHLCVVVDGKARKIRSTRLEHNAELRAPAAVFGIHSVNFLNYIDGELDQAHTAKTFLVSGRKP